MFGGVFASALGYKGCVVEKDVNGNLRGLAGYKGRALVGQQKDKQQQTIANSEFSKKSKIKCTLQKNIKMESKAAIDNFKIKKVACV